MPVTEVRIHGQKELERAFLQLRRDVLLGIKPAVLEAGRKVSEEAHSRAVDNISNLGDGPWSMFRVGATVKGVYVAPKRRRGRGSPRPNLAGLLYTAMEQAADAKRDEFYADLQLIVDGAAAKSGLLL